MKAGTLEKIVQGSMKAKGLWASLLPIFERDRGKHLKEAMYEVLEEDSGLRKAVETMPERYGAMFLEAAKRTYEEYKRPIYWGKVMDSWDRVTSSISEVAEILFPGGGNVISAVEEAVELIPKALYGAYYTLKTGDLKAVPYWAAAEATSFIPYVGDFVDFANIYVNRAKKMFKEGIKRRLYEYSFIRKRAEDKVEKEKNASKRR